MFNRKPIALVTTAVAAALAALAIGPGARAGTTAITACAQTVTTNAFLAQDLTCPGTGVTAAAPGITIDLKGHVLKGSNNGSHGIAIASNHVTIKNGVVRNFAMGVFAWNGYDHATVTNVVSTGNTDDGIDIEADSAKIVASTASGNGMTGIHATGNGATVTSSIAAGNGGKGIWLNGVAPSVKSSSALGNAMEGILLWGVMAKATSTTVTGNGSVGLRVVGVLPSVKSIKASGNGGIGISVSGDAAVVSGNRAEANGFAGGVPDGIGDGIFVDSFATAPMGTNVARGNDDSAECQPSPLCTVNSKAASGLPISSCGQVVTTNAVLTKDLTCVGDGIVVGASGITIDLQGHTLSGDHGHTGILDKGYLNVTLTNGVVRAFDRGVSAYSGADGMTISNVALVGNMDVGAYVNGDSLSITSSIASGNGQEGFYVNDNNALISKSSASGNGTTGIYVFGNAPSVTSTTAAGNKTIGIWLVGAEASVKSSSTVGNASTGIWLQGDAASVASTTISGNDSRGIYVVGKSASLKSTTASGNGNNGIDVAGNDATLSGNRADGNGFQGGASDGIGLGIYVLGNPPVGTNLARGNDNPAECQSASLC